MSARMRARSVGETEGLDKVQALQRVLYRSAKQDRIRRFHALFDKVARSDVLLAAWKAVRSNAGAPGVDGVSVFDVECFGVVETLDVLAADLRAGTYRPLPLRRVYIDKPGQPGKKRPLSIPCVRDRIVMTAAKLVLEPIFEADFLPASYGFRRGRSQLDANEQIRLTANRGYDWLLESDVKDCFSSIDHDALVRQIGRRVSDRLMLKLVHAWLRQGVLEGGIVTDSVSGTPQGSPISPLLANVALHVLDDVWQQAGPGQGVLVRFADDLVILCGTAERAETARQVTVDALATVGLRLHPDKTRIVCLKGGRDGFDFLGFHFHKVESWKKRGRYYLQRWPSRRAMNSARRKIRDLTDRRLVGEDIEEIVRRLNLFLRGWGNYFCWGNSAKKFSDLDRYVYERLVILMGKKHHIRGRSRYKRFNHAWFQRLGVYKLSGTVRYRTAHA